MAKKAAVKKKVAPKSPKKMSKSKEKMTHSEGKWIQSAIHHPGALHKELHVPAGKKIPKKKLEKAAKHKGVEGKRARLAMTLSKLRKKK